jgi:AraC-like DNA-binding protein
VEAVLFSLAVYLLAYLQLGRGLMAQLHQPARRDRIDPDDPMLKRLRHAVEDDRLFLDPALSLPSLARGLRLSPQHVSRLVNGGIGCSFNDYVNRLRVEEACRILAGPDGAARKIGALAYDCGFRSSSVFYAAFRKFTGRTPSDYLKSLSRT